jgi:hypothetical protein
LTGGSGSPPGAPFSGQVQLDPALLGASSSGPLRLGSPITVTFVTGGMLDIVALACPRLGPAQAVPLVAQPLWFGAPALPVRCAWQAPYGSVSCRFVVPGDLALENASLDLIAARWRGAALEASPVLGGVMR